MAFIIKDRVKEGTTTTGTGAFALGGAASTFEAFNTYMSNGDTAYYAVVHTASGVDEWEVGLGTWNTGNTLTRTTILSSSNSGNAVSFSSGTKDIFMTYPADRAVIEEPDRSVAFPAGISVTGNVAASGTIDGRDVAADGTKLDGIETAATADQTASEIRTLVESATDSNVFTDADHTKLNAIEASATADQTASEIRTLVESATDSNVFTDADHTKLNAIEASATADQTKADIEGLGIDVPATNLTGTIPAARLSTATTQAESDDSTKIATTAYVVDKITTLIGGAPSTLNDLNELAAAINDDANYNTTLTTALGTKLPLAGGAMTGAITTNSTFDGRDVATDGTKLDGIESGATADQTNAEIRAAVEAATDSNVFTDADHTKLNGIEASADVTDTANVTAAGALMDSEVDGDIKTLSLPANTTISAYGKTLVDDADAATARTTLGLGTAATTAASAYATAAQGTKADNALPKAGGAMTGAITTNSTFDGRDVATDGAKLDGIASGATNTVGNATHTGEVTGSGALTITDNVVDAGNLKVTGNGTTSQFLRSDGDGTFTWATPTDTNTTYSVGDGGLTQNNFTSTLKTKLDGIATSANNYSFPYSVSTSAGTNTVVQRNSSGYIFANFLNMTGTFDTSGNTSGMGIFTGTNGSDTYGRSYTAAAARTLLNVADGATNVTNNNQITNGAGYTTNVGDITGVTAGTNLNGGGTSGGVTVNLDSSITLTTVTATNFNTTSDRNTKKDITPITDAVRKLQQLGGYNFTFKDTDKKSSGVIAQEVQEVLPELVQEGDEGHLTVQYGNMVGLLIEAIKEQQTQIDELKQKLNG